MSAPAGRTCAHWRTLHTGRLAKTAAKKPRSDPAHHPVYVHPHKNNGNCAGYAPEVSLNTVILIDKSHKELTLVSTNEVI